MGEETRRILILDFCLPSGLFAAHLSPGAKTFPEGFFYVGWRGFHVACPILVAHFATRVGFPKRLHYFAEAVSEVERVEFHENLHLEDFQLPAGE